MTGDRGACCYQLSAGDPWDSRNCIDGTTQDACLSFGFFAAVFYPGLTCDEVQCGTEACCYGDAENPQCFNTASSFECGRRDGTLQGPGTQCANTACFPEPPPPPPPCEPMGDPVPGPVRYETSLCARARFAPVYRGRTAHLPPKVDTPEGDWHRAGYADLVTRNTVRMVHPGANESACRYHYGKVALGVDGYARATACGSVRFHRGDALIRRDEVTQGPFYLAGDDDRHAEAGYATAVAPYRTPYVTEVMMHSRYDTCGVPV